MTPEQQSALEAIESKLAGEDHNLQELSDEDFSTCVSLLMPAPSFSPEQRAFIGRWFLEASPAQATDLEQLWPAGSQYPPREHNGRLLLSIDLLSDALNNGRLASMLPILVTCPIVRMMPEEWPQIDFEE